MICMNKHGELIQLQYHKKCPVKGSVYVKYLDGLKKGNFYIELEPDSLVKVTVH
ncbi:hypothetical protein D515_00009 [Grimontia indica]|uniref:Uncharacterized protein n=3 Tax=Grimontia TaxID=246861 RepID=A0A128FFX8_9GAMM|nr:MULTISPECIES: hypothetical protein [Grimontia]EOD81851.1 hypothetical protein D515_00009 [Grimontia indica]WRV97979.1 hypothetical protein VP504_00645 [Grimontia sp. NTOU-MAR1]CZF79341.1 hypothetical protein GCE9029_01405 [Grimontia celer]CZF85254.1 hypothetical protein GMA8713_03448 [Grimontia marina]